MHSLKYRLNLVNYRTIPRTTAVVEVVKDDLSHHYKWRSDSPLDARFDLTSMIGNVNGRFKWGQSAFEVSSRDLEIKQEQVSKADNTYANFLHGELRNLRGYWTKDRINLDEKLGINEYVDQGSGETYHRLMVNEETLNRADKRQLVLCFDGTSNKFGAIGNTNVVKLVQLLKKGNLSQQMVYYQTGIGTYAPPGWTNRISLAIAKKADEAVAW
ncbi:hypothetical protein FRC12_005849 [Ceratobasidium sp. 428]|nr:hypothetical protein FRC12_005849 [Ceratobasidium sp. 428]